MMARSPRPSAPSNSPVMAVDLPVPVVPMNLKCLVSSAGATARPASPSGRPWLPYLNAGSKFHTRQPVSTRAPRLYRSMASISSDDQIVRLLSIGGRLPVHTDTESRTVSTTPQIDPSTAFFEICNPGDELIVPGTQCRDPSSGRYDPTRERQRKCGTQQRHTYAPQQSSHVCRTPRRMQGVRCPLAVGCQGVKLFNHHAVDFFPHDNGQVR